MIKKLIKLAVLLLIANALYQTAPVWIRHYRFRDALKEMALFSKATSEQPVVDRVMQVADEHKVPLASEAVRVAVSRERLAIDASYVEVIKVAPGYTVRWPFDVSVSVGRADLPMPGK